MSINDRTCGFYISFQTFVSVQVIIIILKLKLTSLCLLSKKIAAMFKEPLILSLVYINKMVNVYCKCKIVNFHITKGQLNICFVLDYLIF
jgi:hypothetical protein